MSNTNIEIVIEDLSTFLAENILTEGTEISKDSSLEDLGVDSFSLMEVILFVEKQYNKSLPLEMVTAEHTKTVETLSSAILKVINT